MGTVPTVILTTLIQLNAALLRGPEPVAHLEDPACAPLADAISGSRGCTSQSGGCECSVLGPCPAKPMSTWRNVQGVPHEDGAGVNMCSYWPVDGAIAEATATEPQSRSAPSTIRTAAERGV